MTEPYRLNDAKGSTVTEPLHNGWVLTMMFLDAYRRLVTLEAKPGKKFVTINRFVAVPREVSATFTDEGDFPYDISFRAAFEERRFNVVDLTVTQRPGGEAVSTEGLRSIPITRLLRVAVESVAVMTKLGPDGEPAQSATGEPRVEPFDLGRLPSVPRGGPDDAVLEWVAGVYRLAHACRDPEVQAVAHVFQIPPSTASKWVMKARQRGHLGAAPTDGRSGEEW